MLSLNHHFYKICKSSNSFGILELEKEQRGSYSYVMLQFLMIHAAAISIVVQEKIGY